MGAGACLAMSGIDSYRQAKSWGRTPLAGGENHYTRFEFNRVIDDGVISILQLIGPRPAASPSDRPGLAVEVNEEFLAKHPPIEGPGYI
jgi:L-alanine-DL-glutamate epimerase-like enolase superfamily enzyme